MQGTMAVETKKGGKINRCIPIGETAEGRGVSVQLDERGVAWIVVGESRCAAVNLGVALGGAVNWALGVQSYYGEEIEGRLSGLMPEFITP